MNLPEYLNQNNPNTSSLRMSKVYSAPTKEKTLDFYNVNNTSLLSGERKRSVLINV